MTPRPAAALLSLLLAAAGPAPPALLEGRWDNAAQHAAADPALHRPPAAGNALPWLDRQHARFQRVEAPAIAGADGTVVHLVWRSGGPDGPVSRQRLWVFRPSPDGGWRMDFHTLKAPDRFAGASARSPLFQALTPADLISYPPACTLPVRASPHGFSAAIPPGCIITAASGRRMQLRASIHLEGDRLDYAESGHLEDGQPVFVVPGTGAYRFWRQ